MKVQLSKDSLNKLASVKEPLRKVCLKAFEKMPFDIKILEGIRTIERQKELVSKGASQTLKSRHLTGDAIDIAPYPIDWNDIEKFKVMATVMKEASKELGIPIVWGGDWKTLVDCPHFQLE